MKMIKLEKDGKTCNCGQDQLVSMKKAGWKDYVAKTPEKMAAIAEKAEAAEKAPAEISAKKSNK